MKTLPVIKIPFLKILISGIVFLTPLASFAQCTISFTSDFTACNGTQQTLSATSTSADVTSHKWYTAQTGGSGIATTTQFRTNPGGAWVSQLTAYFPSSTTTSYWVAPVCNGVESSTRYLTKLTTNSGSVITVAINPNGNPTNFCAGDNVLLTASGALSNNYSWSLGSPNSPSISGLNPFHPTANGTYFASASNSCNIWTSSNGTPIAYNPVLGMPTVSTSAVPFCQGTVASSLFTASAANASGGYSWSVTGTGNSIVNGVVTWGSTFSGTARITVIAYGCNGTQTTAYKDFVVYSLPNVTTTPTSPIVVPFPSQSANISVPAGGSSYQWYLDGMGLSDGLTNVYTAQLSGAYKVTVTSTNGCKATSGIVNVSFQNNYNYVIENVPLTSKNTNGTTIVESDVAALNADQRRQTIDYFDDLGKHMQMVQVQASPAKLDIVEPIVYDGYGRPFRGYLPFVAGNNGFYKVNPIKANGQYINDALNFYNNLTDNIADDTIPYSEIQYEGSPINRPYKQYGPGSDWKSKKKSIKTQYFINTHGTASRQEKIIIWKIAGGMPVRNTATNGGFYRSNTLKIESVKDENGNETRKYTDRSGKMILKKVYVAFDSLALNNPSNWALTYYVYDDYGTLRYVLSPELSKLCLSDSYTPIENHIQKWAYRYVYDQRKRMTEKWTPGANPIYMAYDARNRLVMSQDGAQRQKYPREWKFYKYDSFNRVIMTGIIPDPYLWALSFVQTYIDDFYKSISTGNPNNSAWYEVRGTDVQGYTNKSFPTSVSANDYTTVTYFDDYGYKSSWRRPSGFSYNYVPNDIAGSVTLQSLPLANTRDLVTGTKTKILDGEAYGEVQWLNSVNYYDDQKRIAQTITDNYKGGQDITSTIFNFTGQAIKTKTTHINRAVIWKDFVNAGIEGNKLVKKTGAVDTWDAGAASLQVLPSGQNGWIEITASEASYRLFGFSVQNPSGNPALVIHGLIVQAGGTLVRAESGSYVSVGNWSTGDTLRIERNGSQISYKRNGVLQGPLMPANTGALRAAGVLYSLGGTIAYPKISFGNASTVVTEEFEFDHILRPTNTWNQVGTNTKILVSRINYNPLGQTIEKRLHSTTTQATDAKETIDYRYSIRGWLTSINDPQSSPKLFAMTLKYNDPSLTKGGPATYDGRISEIIWRNGGDYKQSYGYYYDSLGRIKEARYYNLDSTARDGRFTEKIGGAGAKGYNLNGNILKLARYGRINEDSYNIMDNLKYTYKGNQLTKVDDAVPLNLFELGFKELTKVANEYVYDSAGNITVDLNKGISSISYNFLNLPRKVSKSSTDFINYIYDATGKKLFQQMITATSNRRTDYAGKFVYQNDTLKFVNTLEGRVLLTDVTPEYQYYLKDHLGNVRLAFTTKLETEVATATLEPANAANEQAYFLRLNNARLVQSTLFDRTNGAANGYSQRLSGGTNERYGIARSLSVMPGDIISMEVWAKYMDSTEPTNNAAIQTLIAQLLAPATAPPGVIIDGSGYSTSTQSFPFPGRLNYTGSTGGPKAYLNYLIFDRNFKFKTGGYKRLSATPKEKGNNVDHEKLSIDNILIKEAGYVYIYLSNEEAGTVDVFFDDFKVTQVKSSVIQQDDYYPFGLSFNSYQRENSFKQNYRYNQQEVQDELNVGWLDYGARMYIPELARFNSKDIFALMSPSESPYIYAGNNPVNSTDINGNFEFPKDFADKFKKVTAYLKQVLPLMQYNERIINTLVEFTHLDKETVKNDMKNGQGPALSWFNTSDEIWWGNQAVIGRVELNNYHLLQKLEDMLGNDDPQFREYIDLWKFLTIVTVLHEYVHEGNDRTGYVYGGATAEFDGGSWWENTMFGRFIRFPTVPMALSYQQNHDQAFIVKHTAQSLMQENPSMGIFMLIYAAPNEKSKRKASTEPKGQ